MNAPVTSKTFKSGNSEAIRLPKGLGFGIGTEVRIEREAGRLVLTPISDPVADQARLDALLDDLAAIGTPPDGVQEREPIEWPERPGL
jgi:antitoxin VapB